MLHFVVRHLGAVFDRNQLRKYSHDGSCGEERHPEPRRNCSYAYIYISDTYMKNVWFSLYNKYNKITLFRQKTEILTAAALCSKYTL